ncbi:MAG: hypothetical protein KAQ64_04115 [Candidatus Pacebacteria bacterium]|nr:hypothetical protein [Candidatus Paceibacterota bacterium]
MFYSFGYKYSIEEKKAIQTGAIIIKTDPEKTDIYKNDLLYKNNKTIVNLFSDFVKIDNLKIGEYNIKVKKEEYFDWEKNINVKGGTVTELKNIVLLKKSYNKNIILSKMGINPSENNIWANDKKDKIAYKKESEKMLSLAIFNLNKNEEKLIANFNKAPFNQMQKGYCLDDVIFSEDDTKVILKIVTENKNIWYLIDMNNKNRIYDLTVILNGNEEIKNRWNFFFGKSLFYIKNDILYKFDYSEMYSKKILENVSSFLVQNDHVYFFNLDDSELYSSDINNLSDTRSIIAMPEDFDSKLLAKITKTGRNTYLILSSSGKLYFINDRNEVNLINSSVKKANFSNNGKRIVYSNDHEIWIYYIKEKISQPTKKELTNELITRFSGNISSIFLYKDEEHLFYKEGGVFKFLELDDRDKRNIFEIMKIDNDNIYYSRDNNSLYYIKNNRLTQIDLDEE